MTPAASGQDVAQRQETGAAQRLQRALGAKDVPEAYLNRIATAVPPYDVHEAFVNFGRSVFANSHKQAVFDRMADRAQIRHRWSCLGDEDAPGTGGKGFYGGNRFPSTGERMRRYEAEAAPLAAQAVEGLGLAPKEKGGITHLIVVSCTGFFAPGIDIELIRRCGLAPTVERTMVSFMGCQAAINGLKLARHIVRSDPSARVLLVSVELCTLHLQQTDDLEKMLMFLIFADGCAAGLITSEPFGLELESFRSLANMERRDLITWNVGDFGFDMFLSGQVPNMLATTLRAAGNHLLSDLGSGAIIHWAVHPGGRSILDAAEAGLGLAPEALHPSRNILSQFGNMSSATILFVLREIAGRARPDERGLAVAFGPGLSTETLLFRCAA